MIEFNDSFSQAAVAETMCAHSGLAKLISQRLMLPCFAYGGVLAAPWWCPARCCTRPRSLSVHGICVNTCRERLTSLAFAALVMQQANRSASGNR